MSPKRTNTVVVVVGTKCSLSRQGEHVRLKLLQSEELCSGYGGGNTGSRRTFHFLEILLERQKQGLLMSGTYNTIIRYETCLQKLLSENSKGGGVPVGGT